MTNLATALPFQSVGDDVRIYSRAHVLGAEAITIGDSVIVDDFVFIMGGEKTTIGSFVHLAAFVSIVGGGELVLEDFVGLSGGVKVYTGNDDYLGGCLTGPTVPAKWRTAIRSKVHIGRHAVIGAGTVILPGVSIGEGVAVGANSVVTKSLEPWTIYAGAPARPLKARPKEKMLALEADLRATLYDATGRYIPAARRTA